MNKNDTPGLQPGKYREIVLAVACFLIFDLAVLMLNFYTSYQISADAVAINLGGRQRMLSQRMAKAAFQLESDLRNAGPDAAVAQELDTAVKLFDSTLNAFVAGGQVKGADGRPAKLEKIQDAGGQALLGKAREFWPAYRDVLLAAVAQPGNEVVVERAAQMARASNTRLLGLMNDLTVRLESVANAKAERLRQVQTAGIVLALLNFGFILLKFIRRLRESDERSAAAQRETSEILGTVREGLMLIDRNFCLGSQYSASLSGLLGRKLAAGDDFKPILREILGPDDYEQALQYATLLLGDRVKEVLVRELNPLREVGVLTDKGAKYLSFEFNRVLVDGKLTHLLVTVGDVSERVALRAELEAAKNRANEQMAVMLRLVQMQPATLQEFINDAGAGLLEINERLKSVTGRPGEYRAMISHVFRVVHSIKGNAAMLGLDFMVTDAHAFEDQLSGVSGRDNLSGEELISVSVSLQKLFERLGWLRGVVAKYAEQPEPVAVPMDFKQSIFDLTRRVAGDQNKNVLASVSLDPLEMLPPAAASALRVIAAQLVRNAVVHGIESPAERAGSGKPAEGLIQVELSSSGPDQFILSVRDDGRGLCAKHLRQVLHNTGRMDDKVLAELSDRQVIMEIFKRGFSTAAQVDEHAGRGVGLDVVSHAVKRIGGSVRLLTQPGRYTEFRVEFAA
ncbi:hypothetical protein GCM10027046_34570 [Uliginosibacterium flavum]|uniref:histidine kinase n=1 Tax=Uliginosibacterium flavum TaxID=1396831 RepID=A0ABV2TMI4_9RHOO